jgi:hypothetical protein
MVELIRPKRKNSNHIERGKIAKGLAYSAENHFIEFIALGIYFASLGITLSALLIINNNNFISGSTGTTYYFTKSLTWDYF